LTLLFLCIASFFAALVDSMVGGGGIINNEHELTFALVIKIIIEFKI